MSKSEQPPSWAPIIALHDAESGAPLFVNGFWIRSFSVGGRGAVIQFIDGADVEVEETPERIAEQMRR